MYFFFTLFVVALIGNYYFLFCGEGWLNFYFGEIILEKSLLKLSCVLLILMMVEVESSLLLFS